MWAVALGGLLGPEWKAILSPLERERAAAFTVPEARARYIQTRFALRRILGGLLDLSPAAVEIGGAPGGKPILIGAVSTERKMEFNHTHTDGLALIAVAVGTPVGIDVEKLGRRADFNAIAVRFFSEAEQELLLGFPGEETFLGIWTRKEAVLKAFGSGLAGGMEAFSVGDAIGWSDRASHEGRSYALRSITVAEGYVAVLALDAGKAL